MNGDSSGYEVSFVLGWDRLPGAHEVEMFGALADIQPDLATHR